jgi:uncharacterized protein (TIGR03067 family)
MTSKTALLVTLMLLSAGESPEKTVPKDLDHLQGEWTMASGRVDGVDTVVDPKHPMQCKVQGTKVSFEHDGKVVEEVTISLDTTKEPKVLDADLGNKAIAPGIYRLEAETFTLCYTAPGRPRPSHFNAKTGSGHKLSVWKRPTK